MNNFVGKCIDGPLKGKLIEFDYYFYRFPLPREPYNFEIISWEDFDVSPREIGTYKWIRIKNHPTYKGYWKYQQN